MNLLLLLAIVCAGIGVVLTVAGGKSRAGALGAFAVAAGTAASGGLMPDVLTAACLIFAVLSIWQTIRRRNTP
jgi:hypothetical protein